MGDAKKTGPDPDPFDLARFLEAQSPVFDTALRELRAGRKRSHWMWFVFPQLRGLGLSSTAMHFGVSSLDEARAYAAHPVLGPRLEEATAAVLSCGQADLHDIFGSPDDLKFCSSMTLFDVVAPGGLYGAALARFHGGRRDPKTLSLLGGDGE